MTGIKEVEVPEPAPKPRKNTGVTLLNISEDELFKVKAYFGENKIDFIIQEDV